MTTNVPARAATAGELTKFRSKRQTSKLNLAIWHPDTVYTARVNQTFATTNGVAQLTYDGGSGTLADVLVGMTMFIGSSAGAYDKGIVRVRELPTSTIFYISETSDVAFADNDYITVVDSFSLWPRDTRQSGDITYMDYEIEYGDYRQGGIIPRIGPMVSVLKRTSGTVTFTPPSPALSACYDGETVSSYLYAFPGANSTSNLTSGTGTASATYTTAGEYRWSCTITDSAGRQTVSYRWVFVDPDELPFRLLSCSADADNGYWSFDVSCYADVAQSSIYDRALVTLYADSEYYNGTAGSIGKISGYDNIVATGWVDGESITYNSETSEVTFSVKGPGYWFEKIRAFPFDLQYTGDQPTDWKHIEDMTVDKALAHILFWTTTAPLVMDCFFTGDANIVKLIAQPAGSLKDQLKAIAKNTLFADMMTNSYGQMFIEVDPQIIDDTTRDAFPVVMDITESDREDNLTIERVNVQETSMIELSGYQDYDGSADVLLYSRAPGNIGKRYGYMRSVDGYIFADQSDCNRIAGALLATDNRIYEHIEIPLAQNNRLFDICPRMYATLTVSSADNIRGVGITAERLIPRKVSYFYDHDAHTMTSTVFFEFETIGADGVTYYPPPPLIENIDTSTPDEPIDFPGLDGYFPPLIPPTVTTPCTGSASISLPFDESYLDGANGPTLARIYLPCTIKNGATVRMEGLWWGDANTNYNVYAVKDGARILTASVTSNSAYSGNTFNIATFTTMSNTAIDGFEMEIASGAGASVTYTPLDVVASGTVSSTDSTGDLISGLVTGNYYCVEGNGGPWYYSNVPPLSTQPNYMIGMTGPSHAGRFTSAGGGFFLVTNSPGVYAEAIDADYGRIYFQKSAAAVYVFIYDGVYYPDNLGTMGYNVRNATARGRAITILGTLINGVCTL
jgi:hypothetical protein